MIRTLIVLMFEMLYVVVIYIHNFTMTRTFILLMFDILFIDIYVAVI